MSLGCHKKYEAIQGGSLLRVGKKTLSLGLAMNGYQKVKKPRAETPIDENEIRITSEGRLGNYITYGMALLQETSCNEIVFKATGKAITKTVKIVELIKRRIVGLHQNTTIGSVDIAETWEPLEEGLLPLETTRHLSIITITLSKNELDTSSVGYQPPLPADQVKASTNFDYEGEDSPNGHDRGRGRGDGFISADNEDGGWDPFMGNARGMGRGRGRGFRGHGRGGYNVGHVDMLQDGGYNQDVPLGRGHGYGRGEYHGRGLWLQMQWYDPTTGLALVHCIHGFYEECHV